MSRRQLAWAACALIALLWRGAPVAQTATAPPNGYSARDDVEIGLHAAALLERRLPVLRDEVVTQYLIPVVRRLVAALPSELQHPEFHYVVQVIDVREVNARALPGGPIFIDRGLIESARTTGEVAGVIAHEVGHIALRHATARAARLSDVTIVAFAQALLAGLDPGRAAAIGSGHEPIERATALLRFAPEYERQADALGALIMPRAGYDLDDTAAFERARARLRGMAPAPTLAAALRAGLRRDAMPAIDVQRPGGIEPASARFTTYAERNLFRVRVPSNWRELPDSNAVVFAPRGGYGQTGGQTVFTHGVEIGLAPRDSDDLRRATDALIDLLASDSPHLRRLSGDEHCTLANRPAVRVVVSNVSQVTGREERMEIVTTLLPDGRLLYALVVAPRAHFDQYEATFRRVVSSIAIIE